MRRNGSREEDLVVLFNAIAVEQSQRAFEKLFHLYNTKLVNFCNEYLKDKELAEDVISDLFIRLWINRQHLKEVRHPELYLFKAARNAALNKIRDLSSIRVITIEEELLEEKVTFMTTPQSQLETKEIFLLLSQAIETLPPQSRMILRLVKEDGMKAKEVAAILNISVRTVENHIYRAPCKLDAVLTPYLEKQKKPKPPIDKLLTLFFL